MTHKTEKIIDFRGSSLGDIKDDKIFTDEARREAGHQLSQVQQGGEPDHWKPFNEVGPGEYYQQKSHPL